MNKPTHPPIPPLLLDAEEQVSMPLMPMTDGGVTKKPSRMYPEVFGDMEPPKQLWRSRRIGDAMVTLPNQKKVKGVLHVCGRGSKTAQIMFISPSVFREEESITHTSEPSMLKGPAGNLFTRSLYRCGFKEEEWYYTAVCKYNVPKLKPTAQDLRWNEQILRDEIETIKPKLIVCLGKLPFDILFKTKFKLKDIQGGFFRSEEFNCMLYPMDTLLTPLMKPEYQERVIVDLKEIRRALNEIQGTTVVKVATSYSVIDTAEKLQNLMTDLGDEINADRLHAASIDAEWHGQTAWSGQLRSWQMAWKPGVAACVRLTSPVKGKSEYVMDQPLPVIREIIKPTMNNPKLKWIGHNAHADMAWMDQHLDLEVFGRFLFDTMFAQQLLNEYSDLKLERCSVQYTDLGRYDIDLLLWKKKHKFDEEDNEGYGLVPDEILIPYSLRDVDCTLRIYPALLKQLIQQNLSSYYFNYTLPFTTDGFYELMSTGLPIDSDYLDEMRETFTHHGGMLLDEFRKSVKREADTLLHTMLRDRSIRMGGTLEQGTNAFIEMFKLAKRGPEAEKELREHLQAFVEDSSDLAQMLPLYLHWRDCSTFNISSTDHLRRWLYDVKKFQPIKTTKKDGIQMAWDKVLNMPPDKQLQYTPAADKQTIKVFAAKDPMVAQIEELKSVQNITKIFLKGVDEKGREQGIHKWIQMDGRIHSNFAVTETGRPRSWRPNILNWPKAITKPIEKAFERINIAVIKQESAKLGTVAADKHVKALRLLADSHASEKDQSAAMTALVDAGYSSDAIDAFVRCVSLPVSLRSAARAPEGCAFIDMDLKTAEVVALGRLSGDENLIKVLTEPDTQFARIDKENAKKAVRICYNDNVELPEAELDTALLVALDDPRILRDASGNILHPLRDVHWEMAEETGGKPREKLDERLYRDGSGKVGNFCLLHSSRVLTLRGEIPIQDVKLTDLLWDGVDWVSHEGVVCNGLKQVYEYQGLWATDNHEVWTETGDKVLFGDARRNGWNLLRPNALPHKIDGFRVWLKDGHLVSCVKAFDNKFYDARNSAEDCGLVYDIINAGPRHRFTCSGVLVSNSIPYGATSTLLERMIEANTGIKPPEGTGQKMIDTHARRYPVATKFQKSLEDMIQDPGYYRSISGRVRHFFYTNLGDLDGLSEYTLEGILSPLKRQARNFPMQNLVADSTARALIRFIKERRERDFHRSRVMMLLYDAMTAIAPLEALKNTEELLRNCLTIWCPWTVHGSTFNFDVDTSIGFRWGVKPTKREKELLKKYL